MRLLVFNLILVFGISASSGIDIYPYVVESLLQLEDRQNADHGPLVQQSASVCYDHIGCFDRNGTFQHLKQLPDTPEHIDTQFMLYTKKNPLDGDHQLLDYTNPESVVNSNLDPRRSLKIITHGFGGTNHAEWLWLMKNAFIAVEDANVIIVNWSKGAAVPHYINSAVNAEVVGAQIAVLFYHIKDHLGIQEKDLHVIGFSLGAQVMGFVGKRMIKMRGTRPGRITGLDPAGPLYEDYGEDVHVFKSDADFVDIIHTNADLLIYGGVGIGKAIGHVDFYPNGGIRQPGCNSTIKGFFQDIMAKGKDRQRVCNHERSIQLFLDSIPKDSCHFESYRCEDFREFQAGKCFLCEDDDCGKMGYRVQGLGSHYLQTNGKSPFCAQSIVINVHYSKETKKTYGALKLILVGQNGVEQLINVTRERDERILPGDSRVFSHILDPELIDIKAVRLVYTRYNGWFAKGTPTVILDLVSVLNVKMKPMFSTCGQHELCDEIIQTLDSKDC